LSPGQQPALFAKAMRMTRTPKTKPKKKRMSGPMRRREKAAAEHISTEPGQKTDAAPTSPVSLSAEGITTGGPVLGKQLSSHSPIHVLDIAATAGTASSAETTPPGHERADALISKLGPLPDTSTVEVAAARIVAQQQRRRIIPDGVDRSQTLLPLREAAGAPAPQDLPAQNGGELAGAGTLDVDAVVSPRAAATPAGSASGVGASTAAAVGAAGGSGSASGRARTDYLGTLAGPSIEGVALGGGQEDVSQERAATPATFTGNLGAADSTMGATARSRIEIRLLQSQADITTAARALSDAFAENIKEVEKTKPNDRRGLERHREIVDLMQVMATGLAEIADALEQHALQKVGSDEPIFLGKAAEVVEYLQGSLTTYFQKNMQTVINRSVKVGIFGAAIGFVHAIGADSAATSAAIAGIVHGLKFKKKA
jgi:hypothetical protein